MAGHVGGRSVGGAVCDIKRRSESKEDEPAVPRRCLASDEKA